MWLLVADYTWFYASVVKFVPRSGERSYVCPRSGERSYVCCLSEMYDLGQNVIDDMSMHISQTPIGTVVIVGQLLVIQS